MENSDKKTLLAIFLISTCASFSALAQDSYLVEAMQRKVGAPVGAKAMAYPAVEATAMDIPTSFPFGAATKALVGLKPDAASFSRSVNDARLFQRISPSVVLIVAGDSLGSGAVIDRDGLVITNWHVINGAKDIAVILKPEREGAKPARADIRVANIVKYDEIADLALLRIEALPPRVAPIRLGGISDIGVGLDVHAIGHPTGEAWTYTKGVISQYREEYEWKSPLRKHKASVVQTQTPINPGNSGGPLLADSGVMIGVNSFKSQGTEGQNFAVSVEEIKVFLTRSGNRLAEANPPNSTTSKCKVKELFRGENTQKTGTVIGFDLDCDGIVDSELRTPYDQRQPIQYVVDRNDDGRPDVIVFDMERKGKWKFSFWDNDYDGQWDLVGFHDDGSLKASRYESYDKVNSELARKK